MMKQGIRGLIYGMLFYTPIATARAATPSQKDFLENKEPLAMKNECSPEKNDCIFDLQKYILFYDNEGIVFYQTASGREQYHFGKKDGKVTKNEVVDPIIKDFYPASQPERYFEPDYTEDFCKQVGKVIVKDKSPLTQEQVNLWESMGMTSSGFCLYNIRYDLIMHYLLAGRFYRFDINNDGVISLEDDLNHDNMITREDNNIASFVKKTRHYPHTKEHGFR